MAQERRFYTGRMVGWLMGIVLVGLAGCGYQFSGGSSFLPKDVRTVYVEPFINRSRDVGIDKEMTTALRAEFYRRKQLRLVDQIEQADAILTGIVQTLESHAGSVNRYAEVLQYESVMTVDVTLRRRDPDEIIWQGQGIRLTQLYNGSRGAVVTTSSAFQTNTLNSSDIRRLTDIQLTETESKQVRGRLMEQFAAELHQRLMEMF